MMEYNFFPEIKIKEKVQTWVGGMSISKKINDEADKLTHNVITIETYPGVSTERFNRELVPSLHADVLIDSRTIFYGSDKLEDLIQATLTQDRVFGRFGGHSFSDFIDKDQLEKCHKQIEDALSHNKRVVIMGVAASLVYPSDMIIYADIPRWEIQKGFKSGVLSNWQADNAGDDFLAMVKRGYFFEWPMADKQKQDVYSKVNYVIDCLREDWVMVSQESFSVALKEVASQPFSLVPFFDPGVWGGHWMQETFDFRKDDINLAWSFNGVPEENSIILNFEGVKMEVPANTVVFFEPKKLLGDRVYGRFGKEFPIRFNFLDTIGGENLSLQVHPTTSYIQETFGAHYTQDESYYILQAKTGAKVYLGLNNGVKEEELIPALERAASGGESFDDKKFIYQQEIKKHDHFSIPGGTIHSSGADSVVLEISATPNRFTFKLWDWDRLDLDGKPRPVHLEHGAKCIDYSRNEDWVKDQLVNPFEMIEKQEGWLEEKTGLHETEFIETRRFTFTEPIKLETKGSVNVLNLVDGTEAWVESLAGEFEPFYIHYAQTFIVPDSVSSYSVRPTEKSKTEKLKLIQAYVR